MMSDGRLYSSYQPEAVVNNRIRKEENIHTSWEYRQYLMHNATKIMEADTNNWCYSSGLPTHYNNANTPANNVPYMFNGIYDNSSPGFGYNNSDLKNPYLTREQLQCKTISPNIQIR